MYRITFKPSAHKELLQVPKLAVKKIVIAIDGLVENPRPMGVKKLKGTKEDLYRILVGDYRIIYTVDDVIRIVNIRRIGDRKDIYD